MDKETLLELKSEFLNDMHDDILALRGKATITYNGQPKPLSETAAELHQEAGELVDVLAQLEQLENETEAGTNE